MELSTVGTTPSVAIGGTDSKIAELTTTDFLKLLVTELTQQDPFEPVKNQDLLNQVSSIRDLEMNTQMDQTLKSLAESNAGLNETMKSVILQGNMNAAGTMIGRVVTGLTDTGSRVAGKVIGVSIEAGQVLLKLDTGREIAADKVNKVLSAEQFIDKLVVAVVPQDDGTVGPLTGTVSDVRVVNDRVMLLLDSGRQIDLDEVTHMIPGGKLLGELVTGLTAQGERTGGAVTGVALSGGSVMLELDTGRWITMDSMRFANGDTPSGTL